MAYGKQQRATGEWTRNEQEKANANTFKVELAESLRPDSRETQLEIEIKMKLI